MFWFGLLSKLSTSNEVAKKITATFTEVSTNRVDLKESGITFFANPMEKAKITFMKGKEDRGQKELGAGKILKAVRLPADGETVTIDCDESKVKKYVYGYTAKFTDLKADAVIAIVHKNLEEGKIEAGKTAIVYNPTETNLVIASKDKTQISVEVQEEPEKKEITDQTVTLPPGKYAVLTAAPETKFTVTIEVSSKGPDDAEEIVKKALDDPSEGEAEAEAAKYETIVYKYSATAPTTFSYTFIETQTEKTLSRFDLYPMTATIKKHTNNVIDLPSDGKDAFVAFELEAPNFDYKKSGEEKKNNVKDIEGKLTFVRVGAGETLKITAKVPEVAPEKEHQESGPLPDADGDDAESKKKRKYLSSPEYTYGYYLSLKDFDQEASVLLVREVGEIDFKQNEKIVLCNAFGKAIKLTSQQKFEVIKAANVKEEITSVKGIDSLDDNGFVILTLKDAETGKLKVEDPSAAAAGLKTLAQQEDSEVQEKKSTNVLVKYDSATPASFIYKIAGKDKVLTAADAFPKEESGEPGGHVDPGDSGETEGPGEHGKPVGPGEQEVPGEQEGSGEHGKPGEQEGEKGPEEGKEEKESESTESEEKEENKPQQEPQPEGSDQKGDDSGNSVNVGAIVGGVIGGVAFIAIVAGLVYFLVIRKKHQPVDKDSDAPKP